MFPFHRFLSKSSKFTFSQFSFISLLFSLSLSLSPSPLQQLTYTQLAQILLYNEPLNLDFRHDPKFGPKILLSLDSLSNKIELSTEGPKNSK